MDFYNARHTSNLADPSPHSTLNLNNSSNLNDLWIGNMRIVVQHYQSTIKEIQKVRSLFISQNQFSRSLAIHHPPILLYVF
jgi:hypothetical protein